MLSTFDGPDAGQDEEDAEMHETTPPSGSPHSPMEERDARDTEIWVVGPDRGLPAVWQENQDRLLSQPVNLGKPCDQKDQS